MEIKEVSIEDVQPLFQPPGINTTTLEERIKKNIQDDKNPFLGIDPIPVIETPAHLNLKEIRWKRYTFVSGLDRYKAAESLKLKKIRVLIYGPEDSFEEVKRKTGGYEDNRAWKYEMHRLYLSNPRLQ